MRTYNGKVENSLWHCSKGICVGCNYTSYGHDCMRQLLKDVCQEHFSDESTIERQRIKIVEQQAEIERLQIEQKALLSLTEKARKEIARIQTILINFMDEVYAFGNKNNVDTNSFAQIAILGAERDSAVQQIKAEAIKEFAERVKEKCDVLKFDEPFACSLYIIDNLVKEMTEQKE